MTPAHIYLSLGKPGDRDRLVEAMLQQQELQVSLIDLPIAAKLSCSCTSVRFDWLIDLPIAAQLSCTSTSFRFDWLICLLPHSFHVAAQASGLIDWFTYCRTRCTAFMQQQELQVSLIDLPIAAQLSCSSTSFRFDWLFSWWKLYCSGTSFRFD